MVNQSHTHMTNFALKFPAIAKKIAKKLGDTFFAVRCRPIIFLHRVEYPQRIIVRYKYIFVKF